MRLIQFKIDDWNRFLGLIVYCLNPPLRRVDLPFIHAWKLRLPTQKGCLLSERDMPDRMLEPMEGESLSPQETSLRKLLRRVVRRFGFLRSCVLLGGK